MPKTQYMRVASYAIIHTDNKILLCRLSSGATSHIGYWTLPGGGLDFGESPEENMIREVEEETGLIVRSKSILEIDNFVDRSKDNVDYQGIRIIYDVEVIGGELRNEVDGSTDLCQWHPIPIAEGVKLVDLAKLGVQLVTKLG